MTMADQLRHSELLSKDHTILERPFMEFRPFGEDEQGEKIRDLSGVSIGATVEYLEQYMERTIGTQAGVHAVQELCRLLNERIREPAYHVTPAFLKNKWNSYSSEFGAYLYEFCEQLTGDPQCAFHAGKEKITPIIQTLGRPFSVSRIYAMYPHFADKYGSLHTRVVKVTPASAVLAMQFTDQTYQQYGRFLKRCAYHRCQSAKGIMTAVPERVHRLPPATVADLACIANGDDWCEWEITWTPHGRQEILRRAWERLMDSMPLRRPRTASIPSQTLQQPLSDSEAGLEEATEALPKQGRVPDQGQEPDLLSKEHTILERPFMLYRPFGVDERGEKIADLSGMIVRDNVEFLEECVVTRARSRQANAQEADAQEKAAQKAGAQAVEELCRLLNERIRDPAYHVTTTFLKNVWNSYSYEFASFLREFCRQLSGDPQFHFNVGKAKHISPLIQTLGRPFPLSQIHKMYPYFANKFARGLVCTVVEVTDRSAILRLQFAERTLEQFGPYRKACAEQTCESSKGRIAMVPPRLHELPPATVRDRTCIVKGDDCCEWEVAWTPQPQGEFFWPTWGLVASGAAFIYLRLVYPAMSIPEVLVLAMVPAVVAWLTTTRRLQKQADTQKALIQEQNQSVEARHEELREAYLVQEHTSVELKRKINQLTALHRAGLLFSSTLDRETLLQNVLEALLRDLHYDRAMISFYDPTRRIAYDARVLGVSKEIADFARSREVPIVDPDSLEGTVVLQGKPMLIGDIQEVWERLHPLNQRLATITNTKSLILVPLKTKDRVLGSLTVDRMQPHSLTQDDLELMVTVANQVAIALDNASAYRQIEELNVGLEAKVRERTAALERFLARVSHDLRTPLTSMTGFAENMLAGLTGPLAEKQRLYLARIIANGCRLGRLVDDLLDLLLDPDQGELSLREVNLPSLAVDVVEQLRPLTIAKQQRLEVQCADKNLAVWADADKLNRVLTNLVDNAIKYTGQGGSVLVKVEIEGPHFAKVSVSDTGEGIPTEALPKIFDSSFRVSRPEGRQVISHRLGLSIVRDLVERHGGSITARSEVGKGSEFSFTVPRRRALEIEAPLPTPGTKRVLVADDDPDIRQLLSDRLTSDGYVVQTASEGHEALAALRSEKFDGLILDIGMPGMGGLEVLCKIREEQPALPVIMITAAEARARALVAMQAGAQAYLLKPFDAAQLKEIVERWVGPGLSAR